MSRTTGGARAWRRAEWTYLNTAAFTPFSVFVDGEEDAEGEGEEEGHARENDNGLDRTPMIKASEKLRVARDERNIPNSNRENDRMSRYCWAVGGLRMPFVKK